MPKKNKQKIKIKLVYNIILLIIVICAFIGLFNFLRVANYFKIKNVVYFGIDNSSKIDRHIRLKGENLFKINLNQIEKDILQRNPEVGKVKVGRLFPDRVRIDLEIREPIAIIKSKTNYLFIDDEAKLLQKTKILQKENLPVIIGLNLEFKDKKLYLSKELSLALMLLKAIREFEDLEEYSITKVDVSNIKNTSFFINNGIEIKIGDEDFENRLEILSMLLGRLRVEIKVIKYIDLRYKEPVVAKK